MFEFLKNKKILNKMTVDIIFYLFVVFGLPAIAIIAFQYKLSIVTTSIIYSVLMITLIILKSFYDAKRLNNVIYKNKEKND